MTKKCIISIKSCIKCVKKFNRASSMCESTNNVIMNQMQFQISDLIHR